MIITHTIAELAEHLQKERESGKSIGFVPTMGALHAGHIALVERSLKENDVSVVSIFVNPTQFNDKNDLLKYPRTLEADCLLLNEIGSPVIFAPTEQEVYPEVDNREFDFGNLANVMEGYYRPGHFNGVAQVVSRLFDIVQPDKAYFGNKDFQQLAIIKAMTKQLDLDIEIVACPIIREPDGLAMSSRNTRLTPSQRKESVLISQTLFQSQDKQSQLNPAELKEWLIKQVNDSDNLEVEYFDIVDGDSLQSVDKWEDSSFIVGCIAVFAGEVRLIDNIIYKQSRD